MIDTNTPDYGTAWEAEHSRTPDYYPGKEGYWIYGSHIYEAIQANGEFPGISISETSDDFKAIEAPNDARRVFQNADASAGFTDDKLNLTEARLAGLTYYDKDGDNLMSLTEIDRFGEADKQGGNVDNLLNAEEAKQAGLTCDDKDGDGLMSRSEYDWATALYVDPPVDMPGAINTTRYEPFVPVTPEEATQQA
jgi:hypothetical protein